MRRTPITSLILSSLILVALFVGGRVTGYAQACTLATQKLPVTPGFAIHNFLNGRLGNAVFVGKHLSSDHVRQIPAANLVNLFTSQNSALTILTGHIRGIAEDATNKKVVRANTGRIVAGMAANHSPRDRTIGQLVSETMSGPIALPLFDVELSVSTFRMSSRGPKPAGIIVGFLDLGPESNISRNMVSVNPALDRTIFSDAAANSKRFSVKRQAAELTNAVRFAISGSNHFKSPKFDLARDTRARQRSGISLKTKPLYHKAAASAAEKSINSSTAAQTCTPPLWQGFVNSCQGLSIRWLNRDSLTLIDHYEVRWHTDGLVQQLAGSAITASRLTGCNWASHVTITQFNRNGSSCSVTSTGSAPHSFPCDLCSGGGGGSARISAVNGANYGQNAAPGSIIALFHEDFGASPPESASFLPLPFTLRGLSVQVGGHQAGLFYVSRTQINCLVPAGAFGLASIQVTRPDGGLMTGDIPLFDSQPGLFTVNASGTGTAAANIERRATQTLLVLWGTGFNIVYGKPGFANTGSAEINLGGQWFPAVYVGDSPGLAGLDQLNFLIPNNVAVGRIGAFVRMTRSDGRQWTTQGVDVVF